jgi:hypothetical protein
MGASGANEIWRIAPNYEPEYVDIPIARKGKILVATDFDILDGPTAIHKLICRPGFEGFYDCGAHDEQAVLPSHVATRVRLGAPVVARFQKEHEQ